jgi:hypothetical protein
MKAQVILIASALLLMSNFAGAQEQTAPSAGAREQEAPSAMDTDGDGTLSVEEFQTAHAKIFKAIDANKDGKVTPEEMEMFFRGGSPTSNQ